MLCPAVSGETGTERRTVRTSEIGDKRLKVNMHDINVAQRKKVLPLHSLWNKSGSLYRVHVVTAGIHLKSELTGKKK